MNVGLGGEVGDPPVSRKQNLDERPKVEDKSLWIKWHSTNKFMKFFDVALNPVVTLASLVIIIAFVAWCMDNPEAADKEFKGWQAWIGKSFTWLYIGSQDIWAVFIIIICFSKYGNIKLGKDDSVPEYNDATWFAMLFSCGVSTGLFFFGVAEPVWHYTLKNRYNADPTMPDNSLAQEAMNITLYHWGLHGWVVYTIMGLILGLMAYREGLPMTLKSCFYPLIGDKIFGWPGDLIDTLSVIATLFGVCTSLGLGTIQINEGLHILNSNIEISTNNQVLIIWCITALATLSVLTGVKHGIRRISEFCFCCGVILMLCVLFLDNTVFLLNLYTQSLGYYFHQLIKIGFHSDAFEQLGPSHGAEDRGRVLPEGVETADGPENWMDNWTIFYWGWWIAWCPFVGMFIAKISYGRTIKEFIFGTMAAPTVYVFMWLIIFGGVGLRMERESAREDLCCHNFNVSQLMEFSKMEPSVLFNQNGDYCNDGECNTCSEQMINSRQSLKMTMEQVGDEISLVGERNWGFTTQDREFTRLSCRNTQQMWFDVMMSYKDLGTFLSGFSLMSLILYFVTSSDSGSLVIDCLASNGYPEPPPLQRLAWAVLEGLTATALLTAGGSKALKALQAVSIASGLVYTILICVVCVALWRALKMTSGEIIDEKKEFAIDILDPLLADPIKEIFQRQHFKRTKTKLLLFIKFLINIPLAPFSLGKCCKYIYGSYTMIPAIIYFTLLLALFVILHILEVGVPGCYALAWVSYIAFAFSVSVVRQAARQKLDIQGNILEDFCVSLFLYPSVVLQILESLDNMVNVTPDKRTNSRNGVRPALYEVEPVDKGSIQMTGYVNGGIQMGNGDSEAHVNGGQDLRSNVPATFVYTSEE
eukprot:TRINITY_DN6574_c0_g1_i10.p1 TRINITY_DN6574_c0_g1~~TRINITY_DN6574_c0_g1_i10.p1  ORF type:complete len:871 (-),score=132.30 TRINITY_DN6574_c0_g1_i10:960-3572(-)